MTAADNYVKATPEAVSFSVSRTCCSNPCITPTFDENAMFLAYAASSRSADLSRQVGAVVVSENREVVATGANDLPQCGGGQYWSGPDDQRASSTNHWRKSTNDNI